ncbi:hypothetical protein EI94DRAFT_1802931 [Lactarius quietus]|nr:hypothetical protein EI94DRAFT_1802931 [Lactarius quietus]
MYASLIATLVLAASVVAPALSTPLAFPHPARDPIGNFLDFNPALLPNASPTNEVGTRCKCIVVQVLNTWLPRENVGTQ